MKPRARAQRAKITTAEFFGLAVQPAAKPLRKRRLAPAIEREIAATVKRMQEPDVIGATKLASSVLRQSKIENPKSKNPKGGAS